MSNELLDEIFDSPRLPSLPGIALEVIQLAQQPDIGIDRLAETISNDPALASKILRSANSSFYAQSRTIATISDAVMLLGLNSVRTLALGFSLVDNLRGQERGGFDHIAFWQRSVLAAIGARAIATTQRATHPEEAFLGGLLHGLGVLTMAQVLRGRYQPIFAAGEGNYDRLRMLERDELEIDHTQVGAALANHWNLPAQLAECLEHYPDPEAAAKESQALVRCVALGVWGADVICGPSPGEAIQAFRTGMQAHFGVRDSDADNLLTRTNDEARELRRLFELPERTESATEILERANAALQEISLRAAQQESVLEAQNRVLTAAATTDPLTGLANRRQLEDFLDQQCAAARRYGTPLSVAMVDIDRFKRVNDTYGHQTGDHVLVAVASAIVANARESDLVARYGGEEFAVIMPQTVISGAMEAAQRIRRAVQQCEVESADGEPLTVTVSVGVCRLGAGLDTPSRLIEAADTALYEAKSSGRNRVVGHDARHAA